MFERLRQMLKKEFTQILRDIRLRGLVFVAPVLQLMLFGYAVSVDVRHIPTGVYDLDNSVESRELVARFIDSRYFDVTEYITDDSRARRLLDLGDVKAILRINKGFGADVAAGRTGEIQILLDGTDSNTAGIVMNYTAGIAAAHSRQLLVTRVSSADGAAPSLPQVALQNRPWFNENMISRNFYVPGVLATLLMLVTLLLTCLSVVREKEIGTIEQIMVTPIKPLEYIAGKTLPFVIIGMFDVIVITCVVVFWFEVPLRGSFTFLMLSSLFYIMTGLGVGLLISTISNTQQQAIMTGFLFFMPAMLLSGFMFPIENMPEAIQVLTYADPLRYFLVIIRGVFLKGVGFDVLWPQLLALVIMGAAVLWFASTRFRKTTR